MSIMIPFEIPKSAPEAEKIVFETLKVAPQARNWIVLHRVKVPSCDDNSMPDFVILIPDLVSVICLTVVAGNFAESPSDQAKKALETLKDCFKHSHFTADSPLFLGYASVQPMDDDGEFTVETSSGGQPSNDLAAAIHEYTFDLTSLLWEDAENITLEDWEDKHFSWEAAQEKLNKLRTELVSTGETITTIATTFHDNLETGRPHLLRLTDDQLEVLQLVGCSPSSADIPESDDQINRSDSVKEDPQPRCVVDGAAGTGKTVLAIEIARQLCKAGETVGLLCSNPYLSQRFEKWAKTLSSDKGGKVIAGTPAKLPFWALRENDCLTSKYQQRLDASKDLEGSLKLGYLGNDWQQFIGETIEDLTTLEQGPVFDYLIVDEAQNLCAKMFLDLQDALLKGGLGNGRWIMFGDFEHQQIISPGIKQKAKDALGSFGNLNWEDAKLETNCRNTIEIAEKTFKLVGIESPSMSGVYGPHVQIEYFESREKLAEILDNLIHDWENRRFQSRQIILLSSGTGDEFDTNRNYSGWQLLNIAKESSSGEDKTLKYSDVYDFQGLESDLVILVLPQTEKQVPLAGGLTLPKDKHLNRVLYTGMSRAKAMLVIVADKGWKRALVRREFLSPKTM